MSVNTYIPNAKLHTNLINIARLVLGDDSKNNSLRPVMLSPFCKYEIVILEGGRMAILRDCTGIVRNAVLIGNVR